LCQSCAKLIDDDISRYPADRLRDLKSKAEERAHAAVERPPAMGPEAAEVPGVERRPRRRRQAAACGLLATMAAAIYIAAVGSPIWGSRVVGIAAVVGTIVTIRAADLMKELPRRRDWAIPLLSMALAVVLVASVEPLATTQLPTPTSTPTLVSAATPTPTQTLLPTEAPYSPTPQPTFALMASGAPPPPTDVKLLYPDLPCDSGIRGEVCRWVEISWKEENPEGITMGIYAFIRCLHPPSSPKVQCVKPDESFAQEDLKLVSYTDAESGSYKFKMRKETSTWLLDSFLDASSLPVFAYGVHAVNRWGASKMRIAGTAWH
jgi:hypothetical protein